MMLQEKSSTEPDQPESTCGTKLAGFDEFNLLLAQPDPSDFKVMSHIIPCPNDIRLILKTMSFS